MHSKFGIGILKFRDEVLSELGDWITNAQDEHAEWVASLPLEVRLAHSAAPVLVLVFVRLLRLIGYPDADQLLKDFTKRFKLIGLLPAGVGWPDKARPSSLSVKEFAVKNDVHFRCQLAAREPDRHADILLKELIDDVAIGRMTGPPTWSPRSGT